ncbi:MAG TPA: sodium:proton antiporter [Firmicutes bacterium]|nr:sodium:proton antiporter [Bacillota bacterium]
MHDYVTRVVFRYMLLFVLLYGFYVIMHGHVSPGGGFSGGMIIGLGLLLYILIFGQLWKPNFRQMIIDLAIIFVGIGGILEIIKFLIPHEHGPIGIPGTLFSVGIMSVANFGIGILVTSTILAIYYMISEEA